MVDLYVCLRKSAAQASLAIGEFQPTPVHLGPLKLEHDAWQSNHKQEIKKENSQRARSTIRKDIRVMVNSLCSKYCPQDQTGMFLLGSYRWPTAEQMVILNVQEAFQNDSWNPDTTAGLRKHMMKYMSSVNETIRSSKRSGQSMKKRLDEAAAWRKAYEKIYKKDACFPGLDELRSRLSVGKSSGILTSTSTSVPPLGLRNSMKKVGHMDPNGSTDPVGSFNTSRTSSKVRKATTKRKRRDCSDDDLE